MKKIFTFILALIAGAGTIFAESGTCGADGDNLTWTLTDGVLTISGTGDMKDFSSEDPSWAPYISSIQSVVIEEGVENIGMYAFWQCSALTAVTIPKSVWSIGQCAFNACYVLSSITIPSNVSFIGAWTFYGCTGLTSITCKAKEPPYCSSDCFGFVNNSIPVYVPQGTKAAYKDANEWKEFNNILDELPCEPIVGTCGADGDNLTWALSCEGVLTISGTGDMADWNTDYPAWSPYISTIKSIVIEEGIISIGAWAFYNCSNLTTVTIPNSVTIIGTGAFYNCSNLTTVTIPNSVVYIVGAAFAGCSALSTITIPNSVLYIGDIAFQSCTGLTSITCKATTPPSCGTDCFKNVDKSIPLYVPQGTKEAYKEADEWKEFSNIMDELPCEPIVGTCGAEGDNLTWALSCDGVLTISGKGAMADYESSSDVPWIDYRSDIQSLVIEEGVTSIGTGAFYDCRALTSIAISNSVTSIGFQAFGECIGLSSVTIPNSVKSIGDYAFIVCESLTSVKIGNGVTSIGESAFQQCTSLSSVTLGNSVKTIGTSAFADCSALTSIVIPNSVTSIGESVFYGCSSLTSIVIPSNVTSIGYAAFYGCSGLTSLTIGKSVTSIGMYAFKNCSGLTEITCKAMTPPECHIDCFEGVDKEIPLYVPEGTKEAYKGADEWKDFTNIQEELPCEPIVGTCGAEGDNLTWTLTCDGELIISGTGAMTNWDDAFTIPWYSNRMSIQSVVIEEGVTSIGEMAFINCTALNAVTIGSGVTSIGSGAFAYCSGLTEITCKAMTPPTCAASECFLDVDKTIPVYAPTKALTDYQNAYVWKEFTNIQSDECLLGFGTCGAEGDNLTWALSCEGVLTISGTGDMADYSNTNPWYDNRSSIKSVVIEAGATSIGKYAFYNCDNLTSVTIPGSVKSIGNYAFNKCSSLASVTIPEGVISIGPRAFQNCTSLNSIALPEGITSIGIRTFYQCTSLKSVTIPAGVTNIYDEAFSGCNALTSITCKATTPPTCASNSFYAVTKSIPVYVPAGTKEAYQVAYVWKDFTNIQEPFDPTGFIAYELVDLSTETVTAGQYLIVFDDNKAHALVGGSQNKDLIACSDELVSLDDVAYLLPKADTCAVTIAPLGTDSFSILLADGTSYMDQTAKNSVTTSATASGFAITDSGEGDKTVKIAKFLPSENKTFVLKQNNNYFRMYSSTTYSLPKLYRKKIVKYTVTFVDWDGTELKKEAVEYGKAATAPADPTRAGYRFTGWDKAFDHIIADLTVTAQYEAIDYTPTNLKADLEPKESDLQITLSWDKVEGAASYELRLVAGEKELFSQNTMGLNVISSLLSVIEKTYSIDPGTYTMSWAVRSTDAMGKAISDWAAGPQFEITIKGSGTGVENVQSDNVPCTKVLHDGQIYILRGDKIYTVTGQMVK